MNNKSWICVAKEYGGITVTCDDESFAQLCDAVFAAPSLEGTLDAGVKVKDIKFIRILRTSTSEPPPRRYRWLAWIPAIVASVVSAIATITGYVVIVKWLL